VHQSIRLADRVYVLENGRIVRSGSQAEIREDAIVQQAYLGRRTALS
jgi:branched-chain amino acid transport system ATP-binding protein